MNDSLGDRMKLYEGRTAGERLMPLLPAFARLDGRAFHAFTRGLARPYEPALCTAMAGTLQALMEESGAQVGYTQSDEITLAWYQPAIKSQIYFDGRIHKMVSQLAAQASVIFNRLCRIDPVLCERADREPTFDCRVWNVPNLAEAVNVFVWREWDAVKNSISMAAACHYSDRELYGKHTGQKQEMLFTKGINWNDYPVHFKRGVYRRRKKVLRPFAADELERLPAHHEARLNPELLVERSVIDDLDQMPPLTQVSNAIDVLFFGADVIVRACAEGKESA